MKVLIRDSNGGCRDIAWDLTEREFFEFLQKCIKEEEGLLYIPSSPTNKKGAAGMYLLFTEDHPKEHRGRQKEACRVERETKSKGERMKISLEPRRIWGKLLYFPACELSTLLVQLHRDKRAKRPAFNKEEVLLLKKIGFELTMLPSLDPECVQ